MKKILFLIGILFLFGCSNYEECEYNDLDCNIDNAIKSEDISFCENADYDGLTQCQVKFGQAFHYDVCEKQEGDLILYYEQNDTQKNVSKTRRNSCYGVFAVVRESSYYCDFIDDANHKDACNNIFE